MRPVRIFFNIVRNVWGFLKVVSLQEEIDWNYISGKKAGSSLEEGVKVYSPYSLVKVKIGRGTYISGNSEKFKK